MEKVHPKLLEKILARNLAEGGGGKSSTPRSEFKGGKGGRKSLFPEDIPKDWNGIANLSSTKLDAFQSPIKRRFLPSTTNSNASAADLLQFDSPAVPLTMRYDQHNLTSTPTRPEMNPRSFVDEVYEFEESPVVEPPSVMKNWATRGYDDLLSAEVVSPLGAKESEVVGEGSRRGFEEEEEEPIGRASIFGEGAGTTARIDELLEGHSFARILDDDEQDGQFLEEGEGTGGFEFQGEDVDEGSFADEGLSAEGYQPIDDIGLGRGRLDVPEDTLFGMPQRGTGRGEEDSFEVGKNGFKLQGMNDMDTLHGGQLLESEPFEASPLANRGRD